MSFPIEVEKTYPAFEDECLEQEDDVCMCPICDTFGWHDRLSIVRKGVQIGSDLTMAGKIMPQGYNQHGQDVYPYLDDESDLYWWSQRF